VKAALGLPSVSVTAPAAILIVAVPPKLNVIVNVVTFPLVEAAVTEASTDPGDGQVRCLDGGRIDINVPVHRVGICAWRWRGERAADWWVGRRDV